MSERPGLYIMVFFILLNSCSAAHDAQEAHEHAHAIAKKVGVPAEDLE